MNRNKAVFRGLTADEVERSRREHGDNRLSKKKGKSFLRGFFENLGDPIIRILLGALAVNTIFSIRGGNWGETVGIAAAVFLAALISSVSEHSSQKAFLGLDAGIEETPCRVRRASGSVEIPLGDVVIRDIMILTPGGVVPADGIMIEGSVTVDQSALTGESVEVTKEVGGDETMDPANRSAVFRGSPILSGYGEAIATAVGDAGMLGEISKEIGSETRESPLRVRLTKLAGQISVIGYVMAALVALAYLFNAFVLDSGFDGAVILLKLGDPAYLFGKLFAALTLGLTVIVMAVPEGLPMMIAVVLSSNLRKMMKDNVLVRKAVGIEAAGSMNILFTDKTGTLTEGRLAVGELILGDGSEFSSVGELNRKAGKRLTLLIRLSGLFNTSAEIGQNRAAVGGNATDRALLDAVLPLGRPGGYRVISKIPFDSDKKYSSVTLDGKERLTLTKGAPEKLLPRLTDYIDVGGELRRLDGGKFSEYIAEHTDSGERVILLSAGSTLIACAVLRDSERREAKSAVSELGAAGIQVVMITGDGISTAERIARRLGIIHGEKNICLTSDELAKISDHKLGELMPRIAVIARALPTDKSRLVRVAQEQGLVVGMTGDGVNDAPALRRSDVGFAMGTGTEVAKEAGDIIILDNNLSSIVKAVLYGRTVFKNIRKFITLQLTMNLCACGISMIGPFIGIDQPVTVLQMLWINVIMDTLGGLAFAGEPPRAWYMKEKPKRRDEPIMNRYMISSILLHGGATLALGVAFLKSPLIVSHFRASESKLYLLTAFFVFFIFSSVFNCFASRTDRLWLFGGLGKNKVFMLIMAAVSAIQIAFVYIGGSILRTAPLTAGELGFTLLLSLAVIPADFMRKLIWRLTGHKTGY